MKLEMRAWDMDIRLDIEDSESTYNQLELIQSIKDLLDNLTTFNKVNFSIVSVPQDESSEDLDDEEDDSITL